ncbi:MAG: ABC transporter substrate-binding protein [Betaproteobacteria bacterium]
MTKRLIEHPPADESLLSPGRRTFGAGLIGATALGLLGVPTAGAQTRKRGGIIRVAFVGSPVKLDPHIAAGSEEWTMLRNVYDNLVWTDETLTARPELAESWESTPDAMVWTFKLRKGVKFHHGRELDADDVVFSFNRILDPATASPARTVFSMIDRVEKVNPQVVRFTLKSPFAEFAQLVGGSFQAKIAPRDVSDLNKNPTGTGAFKLTEFVAGDHITLVRNDAYWRDGEPYLDQVRFVYLPEEAAHIAGMMSGDLDMTWWPSAEVIPIYQSNKDITVSIAQSLGYQPIVMRVDQPPFDKPEVRRAFRLLCNRESLKKTALGNLNVPVSNDHPIPPFSAMYMEQKPLGQDIDTAKKLLADAGYKDGLDIEMMAWTGRAGLVQSALGFQDMAKKANVRIRVNTVPSDIFLSKYWLKHNFFVTNWNGRTTLYEMLALTYQSNATWNESQWKSKKMDDLIELVRREQNEAKRKAVFAEVQKMFIEDSPVIIAYHRPSVIAYRKQLVGFTPHPSGWLDFRRASLA